MNKDSDLEKYYDHLDHQDWKTVVVKKDKDKANKERIEKNKKNTTDVRAKKIEKKVEEDDLKHKKIPNDLKQKIITGRCNKKLTQKELAQKCNFPLQIINDIECGKAIYNHVHINKIKRVLNI